MERVSKKMTKLIAFSSGLTQIEQAKKKLIRMTIIAIAIIAARN